MEYWGGGGWQRVCWPPLKLLCGGTAPPPLSMPMEYLQRFERSREDKFLAKNFKGTQSDENIRGVLFIVFWAPTDDALYCTKFYKNISSGFKVTAQI